MLLALQRVGLGEGTQHALRHHRRLPRIGHVGKENDELVSTETGDDGLRLLRIGPRHVIVPSQTVAEPVGELGQKLVSEYMSQGIVHPLKVIHVDIQKRQILSLPLGESQGARQMLAELATVGEPREAVVIGETAGLVAGSAQGLADLS